MASVFRRSWRRAFRGSGWRSATGRTRCRRSGWMPGEVGGGASFTGLTLALAPRGRADQALSRLGRRHDALRCASPVLLVALLHGVPAVVVRPDAAEADVPAPNAGD